MSKVDSSTFSVQLLGDRGAPRSGSTRSLFGQGFGRNVDPTPASHSFTVRTAAISIQGAHLLIVAAAGAGDNLAITSPSDLVLRVTDSPSGAYAGSGVHGWNGCSRSSDETADCNAAGITLIQVFSGDQGDRVVNSTLIHGSLKGGRASDTLIGGSSKDRLTGGPGPDVLMGMQGNDQLLRATDPRTRQSTATERRHRAPRMRLS